ncbi:uncharacterized protein LOC101848227 [Aplysia californica]|uniref:Uncharacterized protein LOC101848227 n=1 Tax=Aplysia californica TaxID=6500 RepID=A0ABM0JZ91_APLCA|nr:uncharacterized protein LOC101848227 [Aplysia californica]XP_012941665.1 uncharacterized protein LOC101848227 [Aplysia californica]
MLKQHRVVLSNNHDFLVSEIPMDPTLEAIRTKNILTWHDMDQLKTLRHQGRRALARYFLGVLPYRGSKAFDSLLESLQEANAQHIVDLLLEQNVKYGMTHSSSPVENGSGNTKSKPGSDTPTDTPMPPQGPDPHEYAVRLSRNSKLIREFIDPAHVTPTLTQNKVMTEREADMVHHLHGKNKKWDLILAVLLQRGERAYQAFMAALLQKEYNTMFHTIQETSVALSESENEADDNDNEDNFGDDGQKTTAAVGKSSDDHFNNKSDDGEDEEDVVESDDDIKEETRISRNKSLSVEDRLLRDSSLNETRADDALLQPSSDLKAVGRGGGETPQSPERNRGSAKSNNRTASSPDYPDKGGYYGAEDEDDYSKVAKNNRRGSRRRSNASLALNSVLEESEDNLTPRR